MARTTRPVEGAPIDDPWKVQMPTELTVPDHTDWTPPTINYAEANSCCVNSIDGPAVHRPRSARPPSRPEGRVR